MEPTTKVDTELLRDSLCTALKERDALKNVLRGDEEQLKWIVDQNAALRDRLIQEHQEGEIAIQARDAALARLAEKEGQVCTLVEAARKYMARIEHPDTELAKVDWSCDPVKVVNELLAALTSSSPCRHEEELKRIQMGMGDDDGDDPIAVIDALKIELKRLREVIDWACCYPDDRFVTPGMRQVFVDELRHRTDTVLRREEGEGKG